MNPWRDEIIMENGAVAGGEGVSPHLGPDVTADRAMAFIGDFMVRSVRESSASKSASNAPLLLSRVPGRARSPDYELPIRRTRSYRAVQPGDGCGVSPRLRSTRSHATRCPFVVPLTVKAASCDVGWSTTTTGLPSAASASRRIRA